jgi:hypothetical protein
VGSGQASEQRPNRVVVHAYHGSPYPGTPSARPWPRRSARAGSAWVEEYAWLEILPPIDPKAVRRARVRESR